MSSNHNQADVFGRYRLLRPLGRGGATAVYLAADPASGREVALKILVSGDGELRERFLSEARFAACLRHARIVEVLEVSHVGARPYLSMEFVAGETLASMFARRAPLSTLACLEIATEMAQGLGYAHQMGVPHGDLRPTNVLIDQEGSVRLLDFGTGRVTNSAGLTNAHIPIGPFNYLSPEQLTGQPITARSDIFSFGSLVYELLSGEQAFPGSRNTRLIQRVLAGEHAPLSSVRPDLGAEVVELVEQLLEPHGPSRFESFEAVLAALVRVQMRVEQAAAIAAAVPVAVVPPAEELPRIDHTEHLAPESQLAMPTRPDWGASENDAVPPQAVAQEPGSDDTADIGALLEAAAEPTWARGPADADGGDVFADPTTAPGSEWTDPDDAEAVASDFAEAEALEAPGEPVVAVFPELRVVEARPTPVWPTPAGAASAVPAVPLEAVPAPLQTPPAMVVAFDEGSGAPSMRRDVSPSHGAFDAAEAILRRIDEIDLKSSDLSELLMEFDRVESAVRARAPEHAAGSPAPVDTEPFHPPVRQARR